MNRQEIIRQIQEQSRFTYAQARKNAIHEAVLNNPLVNSAAAGAASSGGGRPSAFGLTVNTAIQTEFRMSIDVDTDTTYTYVAGNGDTVTGELLVGRTTISYVYGGDPAEYQAQLTVANPNAVIELRISSERISAFSNIQVFPNLTYVDIDNQFLLEADFSGLANLTYLDISDSRLVENQYVHTLASVNLTGCTRLEQLRADDSDFSAGFEESLIGISQCTELFHLDLDDTNLSGSINLSGFPLLKYLDLSVNSEITEVIISSSQPLGEDDRIVNIDGASLTQESVDAILVALSENGVTDADYVDLAGGNNAAPSATGLAAKGVLEANGWVVYVNDPVPGRVEIAPSTDFDIVGDFTIEMFVNMSNLDGFPRPYSFGAYPAPNAMSIESGQLYFWGNQASLINGAFSPSIGQWYHICVERSGSTIYMFIDGVEVASSPYVDDIPSTGLPLTIGYGNEANSGFNGLISNFRWTSSAVYDTTGFTVPTAPLTDLSLTKLLIFQGTNLNAILTDNSGNGHNATGTGSFSYSTEDPFNSAQGSLQTGIV